MSFNSLLEDLESEFFCGVFVSDSRNIFQFLFCNTLRRQSRVVAFADLDVAKAMQVIAALADRHWMRFDRLKLFNLRSGQRHQVHVNWYVQLTDDLEVIFLEEEVIWKNASRN